MMMMIFKRKNNSMVSISSRSKSLRTAGVVLSLCIQSVGAESIINSDAVPVTAPQTVIESGVLQLQAEQWELTRSGETVLSLPVLNQLVNEWLRDKSRIIEIRYPGGEEGELWVQELTDWMVSLGIPSKKIVNVPGSGADDIIKFALIK